MAGFKQPDFIERQEAAAKARKVALEKFRAKVANTASAERLTARAAERSAIETTREIERAEKKAREAEPAQQAERDAEAEHGKAESAERERVSQAERKAPGARYAAHKSRSKRR
jgi:Family of unknown function (DUF6481)